MNELKVFEYERSKVRTVVVDDQLWCVAKDIACILEYSDSRSIFDKVPENWKGVQRLNTPGGDQDVLCLSEQGLYFFLARSDKTKALSFQMWIAGEVIPSIRKTGSYSTTERPLLTDWQKEVEVLDSYDRLFRPSENSKLGMFRKACEKHNMPTDILPDYTQGKATLSMTALVKKFGVEMSVQTINRKLVEKGILKELTRKSKSKGEKKFYSVTEIGKAYGDNLQSPQNPLETQPHWYESEFPKLLSIIAA